MAFLAFTSCQCVINNALNLNEFELTRRSSPSSIDRRNLLIFSLGFFYGVFFLLSVFLDVGASCPSTSPPPDPGPEPVGSMRLSKVRSYFFVWFCLFGFFLDDGRLFVVVVVFFLFRTRIPHDASIQLCAAADQSRGPCGMLSLHVNEMTPTFQRRLAAFIIKVSGLFHPRTSTTPHPPPSPPQRPRSTSNRKSRFSTTKILVHFERILAGTTAGWPGLKKKTGERELAGSETR